MLNSGKIIICGTPIGNLSDVSTRLIDSLSKCDLIYAEDTRVTKKLLSHFQISKPIFRLDENLMDKNVSNIVNQIQQGNTIVYCSDAGMPGVSDPGLKLVQAARNNKIDVEVIPGPSSAIVAYVASGFVNQNFYFGGFLSKKENERKKQLTILKNLQAVLIFYESPKRLVSTLKTIAEEFSDSDVSVCRELTKLHEEVITGNSNEVYNNFCDRQTIKGEVTICIDSKGKTDSVDCNDAVFKMAKVLTDRGLKTGEISSMLCQVFGISKNDVYNICLNLKEKN